MKERMYNKEIATEIDNFLKKDDWYYRFNEQNGSFHFELSLKSKLRNIKYFVYVREDDYSVYVTSPLSADADDRDMMARMAEFICRSNFGLIRGSFEFDFRDGEIRFKMYVPCDDIIPSDKIIGESIYIPMKMFKKYGDGIVSIIFTDISAEEAIEICEGSNESRIERLIAQMLEEYPDADAEAITKHIAERLEISGSRAESEEDDETEETDVKIDLFGKKGSAD